jgi:multicomponent Na+:H+ antiporter subunit D
VLEWFVLVPLAAVVLLNLPGAEFLRRRGAVVAALLGAVQAATVAAIPAGVISRAGFIDAFLHLNLRLTNLGLVMLLAIGLSLSAAAMVVQPMLTDARRRSNYVSVLLVCMVGMNGMVLVTDLFSLYVFLEVTSIASFILIAFSRQKHALEGAFKYIILSATATVFMLSAVALLLMMAGAVDFDSVAAALKTSGKMLPARIALGAFLCGLFIKGGLVPFHGWVLGAYSAAPAPTSVLLAGVVTKVSGIYALVRLTVSVFPPSLPLNHVLMLVGAVSIVVGALAALGQTDMKRLLAYSSISQVGYIVLGLGCGTDMAIAGAIFHVFNHAVFKSLLFVNAAAVEQRLGTTDMTRLGGLGGRMPLTSTTSVVGILSTAGIPPLAGFWSKLLIIVALWQAGFYFYAGLAVLFSVVTLAYLLVWQRRVFFGQTLPAMAGVREATGWLSVPEVVLAALTIVVGLVFPFLANTFLLRLHGGY